MNDQISAKSAIFSNVRQSLGVTDNDNARRTVVESRLKNRPHGPIPKRAQLPHFAQVELFIQKARSVQSTVTRVKTKKDILPEIIDYLRSKNLPPKVVHGKDPYFKDLGWSKHKSLEHRACIAADDDLVSIVRASSGVAETGTLLVESGPDNPVTLSFLPDYAIQIVRAKDIIGDFEQSFAELRDRRGEHDMPRTLNMITGPSRTGDIEQTIHLGAHGPRSVHIIVVG